MRTLLSITSAAKQMETIAAQFKLLVQALSRLKPEIDQMQKNIAAVELQAGDALTVIADYNAMMEAGNAGVAASLEPGNIKALQSDLSRIKGEADQLADSARRTLAENAAGKIGAVALGAQASMLRGKFDRIDANYAVMRKSLQGIRTLGQRSVSQEQLSKAITQANVVKPVLEQQIRTYLELRDIYRDQASYLEQLSGKFSALRDDMKRYLRHVQDSKNIDANHQIKILEVIDRSYSVNIDLNALRIVRETAIGLPTANELTRSLKALENIPPPQQAREFGPSVEAARLAWNQLSTLDKATDDSLNYADKLIRELEVLARQAPKPEPVRPAVKPVPEVKHEPSKPLEAEKPAETSSGGNRLNFKLDGNKAPASSVKPGQPVQTCGACFEAGLSCVCGYDRCVCCGTGKNDWCDPYAN
ncbi:MAG: hypothetical protein N2Z69_03010 [Methylophilaceae bacterium]|nr:hypothetical protein [Methylophilaceae bacterium]